MLAFIAAGGDVAEPERFAPFAEVADLVVAADSGYQYLREIAVRPHLLLGDMDSIPPDMLEDAEQHKVRMQLFPVEKDYTDAELALREAIGLGATTIICAGMFGSRLDHTLANCLLLAAPGICDLDVRMLDERQEVRLVRRKLTLQTQTAETVSLIPIDGAVTGVTTSGLMYPLRDATLQTGPALGISNVALGKEISVELSSGQLLLTRIFLSGLDADRYLAESGLFEQNSSG